MPKQKTLDNVKLAKGLEYKGKFPQGAKFVYAEAKKDGLRGFAYKGKLYTSTGVKVVNAPRIERLLAAYPKISQNYVIDGEMFYKNCRTTLGIVKTQTPDHKLRNKLQFFAFDIIHVKEWKEKDCKTSLKRRKVNLYIAVKKFSKLDKYPIQQFDHKTIDPTDKAVQKFHREKCAEGHEGTMIKDPNSFYSFKKNRDWQKLKPYRESDLKIIGAEIGTGRNSKRLGAIYLSGEIDGKKVKTKCGGGFTDKDRDNLWAMYKKKKLVGKIVEIEHEGLTKNNAVRFPQFRRVHPEKN